MACETRQGLRCGGCGISLSRSAGRETSQKPLM